MPAEERQPLDVRRNRWVDIEVAPIGDLEARLLVTVVMPFYENRDELRLTLRGLAEQTYPSELTEVLVVDDGSPTRRPEVPDGLGFDVRVIRQADEGYGLARARNYGAREARGDVLIFLDSDMIPEKHYVEAHARWHHARKRVVTVGFRWHADFSSISEDAVADAVRNDTIRELFGADGVDRPEWIENHVQRTEELLGPHEDLYLLMSGGNLGVDRALYLEAGGTDESFTRWGGEDNELAFRLIQLGAVVVPERQGTAWHQGEGHEPSEDELRALRLQKPKMRSLIADRSTRQPIPGRIYTRPYLVAHVDPGERSAEVVGVTVDSILASDFTDLIVGVGSPSTDEDRIWLESNYEGDPRVLLNTTAEALIAINPFSPARLTLDAGAALSADSLNLILSQLGGPGVGLVHITLPTEDDAVRLGRLVLTRAESRAVALGVEKDRLDSEIGRMFGEKWVSGTSHGLWPIEDLQDAEAFLLGRRRILGIVQAADMDDAMSKLAEFESRRSLRFVNGIGTLIRARSWGEVKAGLRAIVSSIFGIRRTGQAG